MVECAGETGNVSNHTPSSDQHRLISRYSGLLQVKQHVLHTRDVLVDLVPTVHELVEADAVCSKVALLSIGAGTPYAALLGRAPPRLPQLEHINGSTPLSDETGVEGSRHVHRLREVIVSSMVVALAERRLRVINQSGPSPLPG